MTSPGTQYPQYPTTHGTVYPQYPATHGPVYPQVSRVLLYSERGGERGGAAAGRRAAAAAGGGGAHLRPHVAAVVGAVAGVGSPGAGVRVRGGVHFVPWGRGVHRVRGPRLVGHRGARALRGAWQRLDQLRRPQQHRA
ncbi:uncharacterized protein LOC125179561 [Hyalella azteca]|uniref:Uncharacterized protein LOC125179561 n=1 Tax=Hyalella azteca TaxID=294128 RepID=A0A979FXU9_HYAAZ|nr:uncharacterized protein LOC125179561 [Hyalella azteca]